MKVPISSRSLDAGAPHATDTVERKLHFGLAPVPRARIVLAMNHWDDPRAARAETDSFEAERAERRGDRLRARDLYSLAGSLWAEVCFSVEADHPNTRSDLAIAAVACLLRGGRREDAIAFTQRVLAAPETLTEAGILELQRQITSP